MSWLSLFIPNLGIFCQALGDTGARGRVWGHSLRWGEEEEEEEEQQCGDHQRRQGLKQQNTAWTSCLKFPEMWQLHTTKTQIRPCLHHFLRLMSDTRDQPHPHTVEGKYSALTGSPAARCTQDNQAAQPEVSADTLADAVACGDHVAQVPSPWRPDRHGSPSSLQFASNDVISERQESWVIRPCLCAWLQSCSCRHTAEKLQFHLHTGARAPDVLSSPALYHLQHSQPQLKTFSAHYVVTE